MTVPMRPVRYRHVWPPLYLGAGRDDRFADAHALLSAALLHDRIFTSAGGHDWGPWRAAWRQIVPMLPLPIDASCSDRAESWHRFTSSMDHSFLSAFILLLLVLDPLGSLPVFIPIMGSVAPQRRRWVAVREVGIAFAVLFAFMFFGEAFLRVMRLSERSLEVAGGVILLMVAIRMIFSHEGGVYGVPEGKEPLIFPLAVPLLAGPSAMATVLLLASRQPDRLMSWVAALTCAMLVSGAVLLLCDRIRRLLGDSVVSALEKLMGLVLTAIAVEMILAGLKRYFMATL